MISLLDLLIRISGELIINVEFFIYTLALYLNLYYQCGNLTVKKFFITK